MPTAARKSPTPTAIKALGRLRPATPANAAKAKSMSAKYSAGPKRMAHVANNGANSTSPKMDRVPPTKDAIADIARAGPARPFFVISYPSMAVTTADAVPGTLSRMVLIEFPY